jgi:hypothetical protein
MAGLPALRIKAKIGLTSGILVWALITALCGALALVFIIFVGNRRPPINDHKG